MKATGKDDLLYIAGFFDGEGYVGLTKSMSKRSLTPNYTPMFVVTNTDKSVIEWLQRVTGLGRVGDHSIGKERYKDSWLWQLRRDEIVAFLPLLVPYLKVKKERALILLEFLETPFEGIRNVMRFKGVLSDNQDRELVLKEVMYQEMKERNRRGK